MSQLRYRVTFANIEGREFSYSIATLFGEHKAVVLATRRHQTVTPKEHIFKVVGVEALDGDQPSGSDIIDRMEW